MKPIEFPGFGISISPDPVVFSIGQLSIHWYGVIIAVGFLLAVLYSTKRSSSFGIYEDDLLDLMIYGVPVSVLFARLYYVVFNFAEFSDDVTRVFRIWEGGLAIYGAIIGAVLTVIVGSRIKQINTWALLDLVSLSFLIGQCVGRWGNFINGEAYGTPTDLPWRMTINGQSAHPTFLYESLLTLTGFIILHFLSKKRKFNGQVFLMYIAWYGLGRGMIEGLRTDSLYFFSTSLRVSQFLGFFSCIIAVFALFYQLVFKRHEPGEVLTSPPPKEIDIEQLIIDNYGDGAEDEDAEDEDADGDAADISNPKYRLAAKEEFEELENETPPENN